MEPEPKKSFALDLALLGAQDVASWSPADRVRLERLRASDRAFLQAFPHPARAERRPGRPQWVRRGWGLGLAVGLVLAVMVAPQAVKDPGVVRGKGPSVELFVQRSSGVEAFTGEVLHPGETLVVRYTTRHRYMVLAGLERTGRSSLYANLSVEPGERAWLSTGVRLDDYQGEELFLVVLSDVPLTEREILGVLQERRTEVWTSDGGLDLKLPGEAHLFWLRKTDRP